MIKLNTELKLAALLQVTQTEISKFLARARTRLRRTAAVPRTNYIPTLETTASHFRRISQHAILKALVLARPTYLQILATWIFETVGIARDSRRRPAQTGGHGCKRNADPDHWKIDKERKRRPWAARDWSRARSSVAAAGIVDPRSLRSSIAATARIHNWIARFDQVRLSFGSIR